VIDLDCDSYCDQDGDTYSPHVICLLAGYSIGDCDDSNSGINPGATEIYCNGVDENCDPADDNGTDDDLDGYALEGGLCGDVDCDDDNASINPGMTEACDNGVDDDCNVLIDCADPYCPLNDPICAICGNNITEAGEECDDGNANNNDACTNLCKDAICGDGMIYTGVEECDVGEENLGNNNCIDGTQTRCNNITCVIENVSNIPEACDNIDNDCEGAIDEGLTRVCGNSSIGACSYGFETCEFGVWIDCTAVFPREEQCDLEDDDCDTLIDENLTNMAPEVEHTSQTSSSTPPSQSLSNSSQISGTSNTASQ